jgi:PAT family acetyl-CoA transporter-like MFS transporter 1
MLTRLGWALTLLSKENLAYASTAQTVGLTAGQFLSYTVFLAFNSKDFANKWFRGAAAQSETGLLELDSYLTFWGWAYLLVTLGLAVMKREDRDRNTDGIKEVYTTMWGILKLKNIQSFIIIHLIAKIGFQANDAVTSLKLLDKGLKQEELSLVILVDFPVEVFLGYYVGKWCQTYPAMHIWCYAFVGRLAAAGFAQFVVSIFPAGGATGGFLLVVIAEHVLSTFMNTVMFVAVSAFHAKISDPLIGGTYMTLLATYVLRTFHTFPLLTDHQCIQSWRHIPPLLRPQSRRHVHRRYLHSSLYPTQDRPPQRPACHASFLVRVGA